MVKVIVAFLAIVTVSCSSSNLEYVKLHGPDRWRELGYEPVAYEGFQWGKFGFGTNYGGACVWWQLRAIPDNGIRYTGCLQRWGEMDLQAYGPVAVDAIKPQ